jgi:uncharacterized protein YndB with AHSA1/START domain
VDVTTESTTIERELAIAARPETVWELLTDPIEVTRWMGQSAAFDLRPGGTYRLDVIPGNVASGVFVEIDPPRRLVFTWGWDASASSSSVASGSTTIEFDLVADGDCTLLRFRHSELPSAEAAASHGTGWDHYLARLAAAAAGDDPGVDPWISGPMS